METQEYGIVTLFDAETEAEAIRLSEGAADILKSGTFSLGRSTCIPHVSHWHGSMTRSNLRLAISQIDRAVDLITGPIEGVFRKVEFVNKEWMFWQEEEGLSHRRLHECLVHAISALREHDIEVSWKMSEKQKKMRDTYGYPNCMETWDPHITLTVHSGDRKGFFEHVRKRDYRASKIAIVRLGSYGTAIEIVESFILPQ